MLQQLFRSWEILFQMELILMIRLRFLGQAPNQIQEVFGR